MLRLARPEGLPVATLDTVVVKAAMLEEVRLVGRDFPVRVGFSSLTTRGVHSDIILIYGVGVTPPRRGLLVRS
jgi:hypothetical protein